MDDNVEAFGVSAVALNLFRIVTAMALIVIGPLTAANASTKLTAGMDRLLQKWLLRHPTLRLATDRDCACADDIQQERKVGDSGRPIPDYEPYVLIGDFRQNRQVDFAAVVTDVSPRKHPRAYILIFDGPFNSMKDEPVFFGDSGVQLEHSGLFINSTGVPLFGRFESEGCEFEPKNRTYDKDCGNP